MEKLNNEKSVFLETVVPQWDKAAEERQDKMNLEYKK